MSGSQGEGDGGQPRPTDEQQTNQTQTEDRTLTVKQRIALLEAAMRRDSTKTTPRKTQEFVLSRSASSLAAKIENKAQPESLLANQFDTFSGDPKALQLQYGQRESSSIFINFLAKTCGIFLTLRYNLPEALKTRSDAYQPKSTFWHIKTAKTWPFKGHLPGIPNHKDGLIFCSVAPRQAGDPPELSRHVYRLEKHPEQTITVTVTYERQSLDFVRKQLLAGEYQAVDYVKQDDKVHIIFRAKDVKQSDQFFSIEMNEKEFQPQAEGLISSVKSLAAASKGKYSTNEILQKKIANIFSEYEKSNLMNNTVRILRCRDPEEFKTDSAEYNELQSGAKPESVNIKFKGELRKWIVIDSPHIACNEECIPIKGDLDTKNNFFPTSLPATAFKLIEIPQDQKPDIDDYGVLLIRDLNLLLQDLVKDTQMHGTDRDRSLLKKLNLQLDFNPFAADAILSDSDKKKLRDCFDKLDLARLIDKSILDTADIVRLAILKIKMLDKAERNEQIKLKFNCDVLTAAISFVEPDFQHGCDVISPILPENYSMILLPGVNGGEAIRTYGEFDYLKYLFLDSEYTRGRLVDFHPCSLVMMPLPENDEDVYRSGIDLETKEYKDETTYIGGGVTRTYNNYRDQEYSIELMKLMLERSWLELRLEDPDKFAKIAEQMLKNYDVLEKRKNAVNIDKYKDLFAQGYAIKREILQSVLNIKNQEEVTVRLKIIDDISDGVKLDLMHRNASREDTDLMQSTEPVEDDFGSDSEPGSPQTTGTNRKTLLQSTTSAPPLSRASSSASSGNSSAPPSIPSYLSFHGSYHSQSTQSTSQSRIMRELNADREWLNKALKDRMAQIIAAKKKPTMPRP